MKPPIIIIGNKSAAWTAAATITATGRGVCRVTTDSEISDCSHGRSGDAHVETMTETRVARLEHRGEELIAVLQSKDRRIEKEVGGVVIAERDNRRKNFKLYGLRESERILSLSTAIRHRESLAKSPWDMVVFLSGLGYESHPTILEEILTTAEYLRTQTGRKVEVLVGNLKVAGEGLEAQYRQVRKAGVGFAKFSNTRPMIEMSADDRISLIYRDEVTRQWFKLSADLVIVDETPRPSPTLQKLAADLEIDVDEFGWAQSDNVHRYATDTNRRVVTVVGPSRAAGGPAEEKRDAAAAALQTLGPTPIVEPQTVRAKIDSQACARCLTCYRICPHRAIVVEPRPTVVPAACRGCGACVSNCPAQVIEMTQNPTYVIPGSTKRENPMTPGAVIAICCARSGILAHGQAVCSGFSLPGNLQAIHVPCGGHVSSNQLLALFSNGAAGILVFTCHEGNCYSETGKRRAAQVVAETKMMMATIGLSPARLQHEGIAANMGAAFSDAVNAFEKLLRHLE